ncbi:hypothetical protein AB3X94_22360 [Paraburkholderia sp. BR10923]|uniref:hypothetical protein n=1 Tax=Paraburkholderia sp. BR10923 TaxID=3236992 RepID=UPI0034CD88F9
MLKGAHRKKQWEAGLMVCAFASQISTVLTEIPERVTPEELTTDSSVPESEVEDVRCESSVVAVAT